MQKQYVTYKSIYIFIYSTFEAYLQFIFTDQRKKKSSKQDIMSNTAVPSLRVNDTSALPSEENQEEGLLLEICTPTLKSNISLNSVSSYRRNLIIGNDQISFLHSSR